MLRLAGGQTVCVWKKENNNNNNNKKKKENKNKQCQWRADIIRGWGDVVC